MSDATRGNNKRNYIRRKKFLNESMSEIKATLEFIRFARGEKVGTGDSQREAMLHAQAIEAVCWSPHSRLSSDSYQKLMAAKTHELCGTILKKSLPSLDMTQLQKLSSMLLPERAKTPQPTLPIPIIPPPQPQPHALDTNFEFSTAIGPSSLDLISDSYASLDPPFMDDSLTLAERSFDAFDPISSDDIAQTSPFLL